MHIKVNQKCIGCGTCTVISPEVFEMEPDGKSYVKKEYLRNPDKIVSNPQLLDKIKKAVESCPVGAIEVED